MNIKISRSIKTLIFTLILILPLFVTINAAETAGSVTIILDSSSKYVEPNTDFTIDIYLESTSIIAGVQLMLSYDESVTLEGFEMGEMFEAQSVTDSTISSFKHDETAHTLKFVAVASDTAAGYTEAAVKTGYVMRLTFKTGETDSDYICASTKVVTIDIEKVSDESMYNSSKEFIGFSTIGNTEAKKIALSSTVGTSIVYNVARRNYISGIEGITDGKYDAGDIDCNGSIDNDDLLILKRFMVGFLGYTEKEYSKSNKKYYLLDLNGDGDVTNDDVLLLARYMADWKGMIMY